MSWKDYTSSYLKKKKWLIRFTDTGMMSNWYTVFSTIQVATTEKEALQNACKENTKRLARHYGSDNKGDIHYFYRTEVL